MRLRDHVEMLTGARATAAGRRHFGLVLQTALHSFQRQYDSIDHGGYQRPGPGRSGRLVDNDSQAMRRRKGVPCRL